MGACAGEFDADAAARVVVVVVVVPVVVIIFIPRGLRGGCVGCGRRADKSWGLRGYRRRVEDGGMRQDSERVS